jgi:urease accessory protein
MRILLALAMLAVTPTLAFAHAGDHSTGFAYGLAHPIGGLDHILAMVAVGIFAFVLGGKSLWAVPASFVSMMVFGFALGVAQIDLPFVEFGIAASVIVIGAAAAFGKPMPVALASALVGLFAIFHGYAHGAEMPANGSGFEYAAGFVVATALLHTSGIAASFGLAKMIGKDGKMAARVAGAAFAAGGMGILAGWL